MHCMTMSSYHLQAADLTLSSTSPRSRALQRSLVLAGFRLGSALALSIQTLDLDTCAWSIATDSKTPSRSWGV